MSANLLELIDSYRPDLPLSQASTIPAAWYLDPRILDLERRTVFARSWQPAGRIDQVSTPGQYVSCQLPAGDPIVVVRAHDNIVRSFFNVCRHHAAAVVTEPQGSIHTFRCPYHGWTYALDGGLKGTPDFTGVCDFDRSAHGLVPVESGAWEKWMFVCVERNSSLAEFLGSTLVSQFQLLGLAQFQWVERRHYMLDCNWKVFVDNYLDGGYHVPHVHRGLDSMLDYGEYTIQNGEHFCLQSSPIVAKSEDKKRGKRKSQTRIVQQGDRACYYWLYPNFMINCYGRAMDTNLVIPHGVDRTEVIFDFYFTDVSSRARAGNRKSIGVSQQIQDEDVAICAAVQRGLSSRAYTTGRLSVRREGGEHLFHRLLHADLKAGL